jgi:biopolymer transport protein ExbD
MKNKVKKSKLMAEINITPFTDVVLVLLIIFMIATPLIYQSGVKVELPRGSTSEKMSKDIIITINARGDVFLEDAKVDLDTLKHRIVEMVRSKADALVIVNGDKNVKYDSVIQVMDVLTHAGVKNPGLGIELKNEKIAKYGGNPPFSYRLASI